MSVSITAVDCLISRTLITNQDDLLDRLVSSMRCFNKQTLLYICLIVSRHPTTRSIIGRVTGGKPPTVVTSTVNFSSTL